MDTGRLPRVRTREPCKEGRERTSGHGFICRPDLQLIEIRPPMVALVAHRCGRRERQTKPCARHAPSVASACFHISSPPNTSSTALRSILVREVICGRIGRRVANRSAGLTCFDIGNSYAQVLQAHLLYPVSDEITSRFAHVGQKSMFDPTDVVTRQRACRFNLAHGLLS